MTLEITRGDDRTITGVLRDRRTGAPWVITDATLWFTAKRRLADDDPVAVIRKSNDVAIGGLTITDGPNGLFAISISSADTYGLPDRETLNLFYDLQMSSVEGKITTLARGRFVVNCDVTRSTG